MKKLLFVTTFLVLVSLACDRTEPTTNNPLPPINQESISIAEAKEYFINSVLPSTVAARAAAANKYERIIDWDAAKKVKQANGLEVIAAPVSYKTNGRPGVIMWDDQTSEEAKRPAIENVLDARECLLTYKDKSGSIQTQLVQYIASKDYKARKKGGIADDFTGWVMALTWDETIIAGYEFKNGKDVRQLIKGSKNSGGRTAGCDFTYYQNVTANCYPCGSNCTACDVFVAGGYQGTCTGPSSNSGTDPNTGIIYGGTGIYTYAPPPTAVDITNTALKPCMQDIMTDIKKLANGNIGNIIKVFSNNDNSLYNWKLVDGTLPPNTNAQTSQRFDAVTKTVTTTFDGQKFLDASDLSMARTIIHESIHAYLINHFRVDPATANAAFPQLVQDYANQVYGGNANAIQHDQFVRSYVTEIAIALAEFDILRGYNNQWSFYEDLAWGGLEGTPSFANLSSQDQQRIRDRVLVELTGKDSNGTPQAQVGRDGGCN